MKRNLAGWLGSLTAVVTAILVILLALLLVVAVSGGLVWLAYQAWAWVF